MFVNIIIVGSVSILSIKEGIKGVWRYVADSRAAKSLAKEEALLLEVYGQEELPGVSR